MADNVMLIGESFVSKASGDPSVAEMLAARDRPVNPYFDPAIAAPARP